MEKKDPSTDRQKFNPTNDMLEGNDKFPGEEEGKGELVTNEDLKGKKVDGDPAKKSDQPSE